MENREKKFLSEVRELISDLRQRIECLEKMVSEYEQDLDSEDIDIEPIDLDIEEQEAVSGTIMDLPEEDAVPETIGDLPEEDEVPETIGDLPEEDEVSETVVDLPEEICEEKEAEQEQEAAEEEKAETGEGDITVFEGKRQLWWTDMPGSPVKDIRSAISLNDRILFINTLFNEDPMVFQDSVNAINGMNSLKEVVDYVNDRFPQWNMDSETVYRFMMAARRRVR